MENFEIQSDLTIPNTKLMLDGKDVSKKQNIVGISFYASSPVKDSEYDAGWVDLNVTVVDENGTAETKSYRKSEYDSKKSPMGKPMKDFLDNNSADQIVAYLGQQVVKEKQELVDKIIAHCTEKKVDCPSEDTLISRTMDSLTDKAKDLGIDLA